MMIDKNKMREMDRHWKELMELAETYGFIYQAYGGTATMSTHRNQLEVLGQEEYLCRQKSMMGINMRQPRGFE